MKPLKCPTCSQNLFQVPLYRRSTHVCLLSHGRAVSISTLRGWLKPDSLSVFDEAASRSRIGLRSCPRCQKKMSSFSLKGGPVLDSCMPCGLVWLDQGEEAQVGKKSDKDIAEDEEAEAESSSGLAGEVQPGLHFRAGRSPFEGIKGDSGKFPWVTVVLILAFTSVTKLAHSSEFVGFVFDTAKPLAGLGLPALLSLFAHANSAHLVSNVFFFLVPGTLTESTLGERVLLEIFILAGLVGLAVQGMISPGSQILGASGGISGVFAALCITQPQARFVVLDRNVGFAWNQLYTVTYRIPLPLYFLGWLFLQFKGGWSASLGAGSGVAYGAHIGGALAGIAYVFTTDLKVLSVHRSS